MKKKILCLAAAAALAASLTVPAWAAVASPYGGAEAEGGDVTYTTQARPARTARRPRSMRPSRAQRAPSRSWVRHTRSPAWSQPVPR